jgi:cell division protein FtsB
MRTDAVHQASELYNYNKSQKELEKEREDAREARTSAAFIILFALILIGGTIGYYLWNQKKRKAKIDKYKSELNKAITTRNELRAELKQLKDKDYEGIIALKESKVTELTDAIGRLEAENEGYKLKDIAKETDHFEDFLDSKIAQLFVKKATGRTERPQVTEAEWIMLENEFSKDNPVTYKSFGKGRPLSQLEQRICILLVLDIPENVISNMAGTSTSTISNLKARANEKLFGRKEAQPLKNNLKHALQRSW